LSRVKQKKIAPLTFRMFEHKIYFKYCRKEACFADLEEQEMLKGKRTIHISVWILAVLLSTMQTVGCRISVFYHTSVHRTLLPILEKLSETGWLVWWLIEFVVLGIGFEFLFYALENAGRKNAEAASREKKSFKKKALFIFIGLIICWLPVLFANYPGFFNYDILGQLPQVMYQEVSYDTHHSLLSTLVMGGVITCGYHLFGTLTGGVCLHSCFQMALCAGTFTYTIWFIQKRTARKWIIICAFAFYALSPTIAMFTISTTKDVVCSLLLLIAVLQSYEMFEDPDLFFSKKLQPISLCICLVSGALYRKNVIYAVLFFTILCIFICRKKRALILAVFGSSVLLTLLASAGMENALHAQKGSIVEAFCIPIQQVARVYQEQGEEAFTSEDLDLIDAAISKEFQGNYNPFLADDVKNYTSGQVIMADSAAYLSLWLHKGLQNPGTYVKAFLDNTYQAWYPGTSIVDNLQGEIYYFDFNGRNYLPTSTISPTLTHFYRKISLESFYQKLPVIRLLFSIGAMFWVAVITFFYGIRMKQPKIWQTWLFVFALCLTVFLGPISLVRYYLILFYILPVSILLLFGATEQTQRED